MGLPHRVAAVAGVVLVVLASFGAFALARSPGPALVASAAASAPSSVVTDALVPPPTAHLRPLPANYPVSLTFTLDSPRAAALATFLSAVDDPTSPLFHHFLTYAQYLREFSPTPATVAEVTATLRSAGGSSVTVSPDRSAVEATFPAARVASLLGVALVEYGTAGGRPLFTATGSVELAAGLRGVVSAVDGLSSTAANGIATDLAVGASLPSADGTRGNSLFVQNNQTGSDWFVGSDYTQAYGATSLFPGGSVPNATFPSRVAVATLLASGYNLSSGQDLPPWDPAVVDSYFNLTFPPTWPKPTLRGVPVTIGSMTPPLPGSFGSLSDSSADEYENSLDLEMAGSLAPGASIYNFYFSGSLLAANTSDVVLAYDFAQSLSEALAYNYSPAHLGVVSGSFGLPDLNESFWNTALGVAAAPGVTVVISSGDQGNAPDYLTHRGDGPWPTWPASAAFNSSGATSVGGVSLSLDGAPTGYTNGQSVNLSYDPTISGIRSMSAWWDTTAGPGRFAGTEGGISTVFPEPNWQFHSAAQWAIVNATILEGASALGRAEPDVAFPANDTLAATFANSTGTVYLSLLGGTSVAAPIFAGLLADVLAVENARSPGSWTSFGYLNPSIYRIASYFAAYPNATTDPYLDVTAGANYEFSAAAGWDPTTGWGGISAPEFLAAEETPAIRQFVYTGPTPSLPPPATSVGGVPWTAVLLIFGIGVAVALGLVLLVARPKRAIEPVRVPFGAQGTAGAPYGPASSGVARPGATFPCPYCGAARPAEPVRCPQCGSL